MKTSTFWSCSECSARDHKWSRHQYPDHGIPTSICFGHVLSDIQFVVKNLEIHRMWREKTKQNLLYIWSQVKDCGALPMVGSNCQYMSFFSAPYEHHPADLLMTGNPSQSTSFLSKLHYHCIVMQFKVRIDLKRLLRYCMCWSSWESPTVHFKPKSRFKEFISELAKIS